MRSLDRDLPEAAGKSGRRHPGGEPVPGDARAHAVLKIFAIMTIIGSAWGVHDRVPDYKAFSSPEDFTAADPYAQGGPSGCGFYRIVVPFDELARHGWRTAYSAGPPPPAVQENRHGPAQQLA